VINLLIYPKIINAITVFKNLITIGANLILLTPWKGRTAYGALKQLVTLCFRRLTNSFAQQKP